MSDLPADFTTADALEFSGVTRSGLNKWRQDGILPKVGRQWQRWTYREMLEVRALASLTKLGVPLLLARTAADEVLKGVMTGRSSAVAIYQAPKDVADRVGSPGVAQMIPMSDGSVNLEPLISELRGLGLPTAILVLPIDEILADLHQFIKARHDPAPGLDEIRQAVAVPA